MYEEAKALRLWFKTLFVCVKAFLQLISDAFLTAHKRTFSLEPEVPITIDWDMADPVSSSDWYCGNYAEEVVWFTFTLIYMSRGGWVPNKNYKIFTL